MTLDEFAARLDINNQRREMLLDFFRRHPGFALVRKDRDLVDRFLQLEAQALRPVVDKKLGMLFGVRGGDHELVRAYLHAYHSGMMTDEQGPADLAMSATAYMREAMGYYLSSMRRKNLVVPLRYRPDRFDRDLFLLYGIQYD